MKILTIAVLALALVTPSNAEEKMTPSARDALQALRALTGTWEGPMWGGTFRAQYAAPSHDTLLSYSRLLKEGKTTFHEFEVFEVVGEKLRLTPHPGGKAASVFDLTSFDKGTRSFTFECPKNDFPSRIVYHRSAENALTITLSAPHHKSDKKQVFALKAVK